MFWTYEQHAKNRYTDIFAANVSISVAEDSENDQANL